MGITIEDLTRKLLTAVGEDPNREGLIETPKRVANYYKEALYGYSLNVNSVIKTFPSEGIHELVIVKDIQFYSLCEHHMVPFFGTVDMGYIPNDRILGLSKFARIVYIFATRLQTQERLSHQILDTIVKNLKPKGCIVRIVATHLCVSMRGVKNTNSKTVTLAYQGILEKDKNKQSEFLSQLG